MKRKYNYLIGKTREEIVMVLGCGINCYNSSIWTYKMKKRDWLGRWRILSIYFDAGKVSRTILRARS